MKSARTTDANAPESPTEPAEASRDSAHAAARDTRSARAWGSTTSFPIGITAQTHFVVLMGFRVLAIIPIVQAETALPRFGYAQIVHPAQRIGKHVVPPRPQPVSSMAGSRFTLNNCMLAELGTFWLLNQGYTR